MTTGAEAHRGTLVSGRFPELEDALCERVAELKRGRPLAPVTVVVGSAAVRTHVLDLLVRRLGAVANVQVTTLGRLAADVVAAHRGAPPAALAGLTRERLVRRLVAAHASRLRYFGPVVDRPHFPQAVAATLADLREACVPPGSGWSAAAQAGPAAGAAAGPSSSAEKFADLDLLYRAYCEELEMRGLLDGAGLQSAAASVSAVGPTGAVVLFGLYDLNEAQGRFVRELLASGADLFVPAPAGRAPEGQPAFEAAVETGLAVRHLKPPEARCDRDALAAVWTEDVAGARPFAGDGSLQVVSVSDERAELREAVRTVFAAIADGATAWQCARRGAARRRCGPCGRHAPRGRAPGRLPAAGSLGGRARAEQAGRLCRAAGRRSRSRGARSWTCSRLLRSPAAASRARRPCGSTRPGKPAWWPGPSNGARDWPTGAGAWSAGRRLCRPEAPRRGRRGRGRRQDPSRAPASRGVPESAGGRARARGRVCGGSRPGSLGGVGRVLRRRGRRRVRRRDSRGGPRRRGAAAGAGRAG